MRKYGKRLLSFVLTLAMIVGMVNMPAKAAEGATTEFKIEKLALDHDYLYPKKNGYWPIWQIYLYTDVELPADTGDYQFELSDGKTKVKAKANKYSAATNLLYLEVPTSMLPEACEKTFTIKKGEYTSSNGTHTFKLTADYKIRYESGVWSKAGAEDMLSAENMVQLLPGYGWGSHETTDDDKKGVYLHTATDNGAYTETGGDWNDRMKLTAVVTNEAQTVFYGGAKWYADTSDGNENNRNSSYISDEAYKLVKFAETSYYLEFPNITVSENDLVRVGGYFKDNQGKIYGFYPITMKYNGSKWEEVKSDLVGGYEGYLTVNSDVYSYASPTNEQLYLKGTDGYASWIGGSGNDKWNEYKVDLENSTGSILVDGQKATSVIFQKYNGKYNAYLMENITGVEKDSVVTIEGSFIINGATVTFEKSQFKWDGSKWVDVPAHSGKLLTTMESGAQIDSKDRTGIYMKGTDSYMEGRTYEDWDAQDIKMKAADENSGVFVDGVRKADAEIWKYNVPENWYYLINADLTGASKVVIKGNFKTLEGRYAVSIEESTFTWDGSKWVNYEESKDITISGLPDKDWLKPQYNKEWPIWHIHLPMSADLPTGEKYSVNIKADGVERTVNVQNLEGNPKVMEMLLDRAFLNEHEGSVVTCLAGTYQSTTSDSTFVLGRDFTFFINQYGISKVEAKSKLATALTRRVNLTLAKDIVVDAEGNIGGNAAGFYLWPDVDDGMATDTGEWSYAISPVTSSTDVVYSELGEGGVWNGNEKHSQNIEKFSYNGRGCYYVRATGTEGASYDVKGIWKDSTGRQIAFNTIRMKYTDGKWVQEYVPLHDSGKKYDVNGDCQSDPTSKDLIALLNYNADTNYPINIAQADIYKDEKYNNEDVIKLRKIIVGLYDADGNYIGAPDYSADRTFEKMAYVCPDIGTWEYDADTRQRGIFVEPFGTWNAEKTVFTPNDQLKAEMQQYKDAGFTLINTEKVGGYAISATDETGVPSFDFNASENDPLRIYLQVAEQYDLGVLVFDVGIFYYLDQNTLYDGWQEALDKRIAEMKAYSPAFKGLILSDEIDPESYDVYSQIAAYLMEKYPELMYRTSYRPSEHKDFNNDTGAFETYVGQFGPLLKHFSYNCYALEYKEIKDLGWYKTYYVKDTWFNNLNSVAKITKNSKYAFDNGITIQTHTSTEHYEWENGIQYAKSLYAPEKTEDMGFQIYTAMAYGMKEINFFDYYQHWNDENVTSGMVDASADTVNGKTANIGGTPNDVYTAVQTVNKQIDKFASVYQAFTWKDTVKIAAGKNGTVGTDDGRLASASVTGAETVIGHMVDVDGFDGYMIANAAGPRTSTKATISLKFTNATKALVYDFSNGTKTEVSLVDGATSVTVPVGGGVMVIPVK